MSFSPAQDQAQRLCDQLPRPPYEYPPNSAERLLAATLIDGDEVEALQDTIAELELEAEGFDDGSAAITALKEAIEDAQESVFEACEKAEDPDNGTPDARLAALIESLRSASKQLEGAL